MGRVSRIDFDQVYDILQSLQSSNYDGPMGPWADVVAVKNISARLGRKSVGRYDVAETGRYAISFDLAFNCIPMRH
jgi:hypothetical protein